VNFLYFFIHSFFHVSIKSLKTFPNEKKYIGCLFSNHMTSESIHRYDIQSLHFSRFVNSMITSLYNYLSFLKFIIWPNNNLNILKTVNIFQENKILFIYIFQLADNLCMYFIRCIHLSIISFGLSNYSLCQLLFNFN